MKIRILRPYGFYEPGTVLDPSAILAEVLIAQGFAEALPARVEATEVERAVLPPVEAATLERATPAKPPKPKKG